MYMYIYIYVLSVYRVNYMLMFVHVCIHCVGRLIRANVYALYSMYTVATAAQTPSQKVLTFSSVGDCFVPSGKRGFLALHL